MVYRAPYNDGVILNLKTLTFKLDEYPDLEVIFLLIKERIASPLLGLAITNLKYPS